MFANESILSGLLAATAAAFGKVAFSKDSFIVSFVASNFGTFSGGYLNLVSL